MKYIMVDIGKQYFNRLTKDWDLEQCWQSVHDFGLRRLGLPDLLQDREQPQFSGIGRLVM